MARSQEETEAYLRLQSAHRVYQGTIKRWEGSYLAGNTGEIELALSATFDAHQAVMDRAQELLDAQMRQDRIDPRTRRSF
ncbi:hypothetical protein [Bradyrhizobium elkanii]